MRRYLKPTIVVAVLGLVSGALFRHLHDPIAEREFANYLRSSLHAAGMALAGWAVHVYFTWRSSAWRWPLAVELIIRSLAMAVVVATLAAALEVILYGHTIGRAWLVQELPLIVGLIFVGSMGFGAVYELVRMVGGKTLVNVMLGRYRRPIREDRVLLFLDLVGSTTLAEKMGELRVQDLLTRFFYDIDQAIVAHGGEVHAYVGDEVIVTWPVGAKPERAYVDCFFAIQDRIAALAESYESEFGLVPEFRAGIHAGAVVISECGDSRRQVAYFGDTVNVAARLQAHCKDAGRPLLISGELFRLLPASNDLFVDALGPTQLRGRAAPIEIFAIARPAHHP